MKQFWEKNTKKLFVGIMTLAFGFAVLGMTQIPGTSVEAATSTEVVCYTLENLNDVITEQELDIAISSLSGDSIERLESMVPDDVKIKASKELGSASRTEYIKWFYRHNYIPGELLGIS